MISEDGFDDPLDDPVGADHSADHDPLDHDPLDHDPLDHDPLDHDPLDHDLLDRAGYDSDDPDSGNADSAGADSDPGSGGGPMVSVPTGAPVGGAGFAGPAEQDATGDGTDDTVVLHGADGSVTTATDYDGDGVADQVTVVSPDGAVTVSATDAAGAWHTVATGEVTPDGGVVFHDPVAQSDQSDRSDQSDQSDQSDRSDRSGGPDPQPDRDAGPAEHRGESAGDLVLTGADGTRHDLGTPDQDLDGDGVPESVAARTQDGHLLIVSDTDQDGTPDQLIEVDPASGHVVWAQPDTGGNWVQVHTGQVDTDGNLVVDQAPAQPHQDDNAERIAVAVDGGSFDAGRATIDADGDGIPDTVAVDGPEGSTLYYQDADGDGVADRAWTADSTGRVVAEYALDARSGTWTPTPS